jgi:NAD(P)-dependent dehydrogenase (short-subunit alcohol dehydrogenase family)
MLMKIKFWKNYKMEPKIIVSGNKDYGLSGSLSRIFEDAYFCSRSSSGHNLAKHEDREKFAQESLNYDVFINCSCLSQFRQVLLLEQVYQLWKDSNKKGHIISLGSTADTPVKGTSWVYPIEKKALRNYCRNLSMASLGGHGHPPSGIRVTYISPGYLSTPKMEEKHKGVDKIDTGYLAELIKWVIEQPAKYNLSEICLDPVQVSNEIP